ncbi:MAG: DUF4277 domain-containing protein [Deltaproteobacteria bacterium]|nr:DUF4277 domain-containing protein [Deltaproteobacteria bacterium]
MSTGLALKAMALNVVTGRAPLYRWRSWAEELPLELLLGAGVDADHLNDSSVARHLDRFFEAGPEMVFNAAALRAIDVEGLELDRVAQRHDAAPGVRRAQPPRAPGRDLVHVRPRQRPAAGLEADDVRLVDGGGRGAGERAAAVGQHVGQDVEQRAAR